MKGIAVPHKELFRLALVFCRIGRNLLPLKAFFCQGVGTFSSTSGAWLYAQSDGGFLNLTVFLRPAPGLAATLSPC